MAYYTEMTRIRTAAIGDLPHLLHHRRAMYESMGHTDEAMLDEVLRVSELYFRIALPNGQYRGYVAETEEGRVVGGGGIVSRIRAAAGMADRVTFVIDEKGRIAHVVDKPDWAGHGNEVLALL